MRRSIYSGVRASPLRGLGLSSTITSSRSRSLLSRFYADEAAAAKAKEGKLILTLSCPHETLLQSEPVEMVTVPATSGEMGILAEHIPLVAQLEPGTVVISKQEESGVKETEYFISGGFVTVFDDSTCNINVLEAVPVSALDPERVKRGIEEFQREASTATDPDAKAVAEIGIEVHQAMAHALKI
jgi:F-type H+-transporting ATPase subunit delta